MDCEKKVAIYIRKTCGLTDEAIKEELIKCCEERGWAVYKIYSDIGYSGTNLERPHLQKLLKDAVAKKFNIILTPNLSMLSRKSEDAKHIYEVAKDNKVELLELENSIPILIDLSDDMLT